MQVDTKITKKYRKKVCMICGADCGMAPDMILNCIKETKKQNGNKS